MVNIRNTYSFEILCKDVRITSSAVQITSSAIEEISVEVFGVNDNGLQRIINEFYPEDILKMIDEESIVDYLKEYGYEVIKQEEE
ncbi:MULTISPECIES: hypothetical protein [Photorhabdus]|uniref:hypothetical protein n=1 Tax=Photorhabdus TaxID=29487 RepID=UPI000DCB925F|nr:MULTISPECIES: hypothetical protein [Photorhabdus]MCT8345132.1 hypothetical protein [Photorhabdus kleinii]RAW91949.1 hypothetical protein CKY05_23740 [Photorhabdus sp. S10-54]RAW91976.1 hypothetical protein CKY03_23725 [Photorhabdus sp. S9-53]RAW95561.1 hypothetical protein CKY04_23720 [Photorhabdus sp. S8-52]